MRIDLTDWNDEQRYADYSLFYIEDEANKYTLKLEGHSGTLGDALLSWAVNKPFSTFDEDNDDWSGNCARTYISGWWHKECYWGQLNEPYCIHGSDPPQYGIGIIWRGWKDEYYSMKYARMRIKPTFNN